MILPIGVNQSFLALDPHTMFAAVDDKSVGARKAIDVPVLKIGMLVNPIIDQQTLF